MHHMNERLSILVNMVIQYPFFICRTSQNKTQSIHLFNVLVAVDSVQIPVPTGTSERDLDYVDISFEKCVPSVEEQAKLKEELVFITATSVNIPQLSKLLDKIYPKHLPHEYSDQAGIKTVQVTGGYKNLIKHKH